MEQFAHQSGSYHPSTRSLLFRAPRFNRPVIAGWHIGFHRKFATALEAMLDGKRYYAMFPDEDPELRPQIRAVLDALGNLDKAFRQHLEAFQPNNLDRDCRTSRP